MVTGWERYKRGFCQELASSPFISGTCFHSYINVVEVRRSGIPVSDPLHELCFSHIDFHPTVAGGGKKTPQPTANCLGDIVEVMKGQNVSEMRREKKMKASQKKALRGFEVSRPAPAGVRWCCQNQQRMTAAWVPKKKKTRRPPLTASDRRAVSHMLACSHEISAVARRSS